MFISKIFGKFKRLHFQKWPCHIKTYSAGILEPFPASYDIFWRFLLLSPREHYSKSVIISVFLLNIIVICVIPTFTLAQQHKHQVPIPSTTCGDNELNLKSAQKEKYKTTEKSVNNYVI